MATALKTSTQSFIEHADVQPSTPDSGLGSEAQSWFLKGIEHARSEEWHEALAIFERVLELDADNATAHYNRAVILLHLQNIEEAVSSFRRALALNAGFQQAYIIGGMVLLMSALVGPKRPQAAKASPFECGMPPVGDARLRFSVKFYLIAMLFILFDVEIAFLFPWAVVFRSLGWFGFVEMLLFIGIMLAGFVYIWKKGALDWTR